MNKFITIWFIYISAFVPIVAADSGAITDRYIAFAIQGDLRPARALFNELDESSPGADRELAARFRQRFVERSAQPQPTSGNALIDEIVTAYQDYWTDALMQGVSLSAGSSSPESALLDILRAHGLPGPSHSAEQTTHALLRSAAEAQGFHALFGPAPPLQDLLLWRGQAEARFTVELTDQERAVIVMFLSDFHSQGWKHYATLGLASTTGWVDGGTLYCIEGAYAQGTEAFEVSYLKHESRHLADLEQFPGLTSADLEYRAKLTELAFASESLRTLLQDFTRKSAAHGESPHAVANYRVTRDLYRELYGNTFAGDAEAWQTFSVRRVNRSARALLDRNTQALQARTVQAELRSLHGS
jgi:hypothetical protein